MPINSKQKGKNGELEIVHIMKQHGYDARRSVQYAGANGDADVIGIPHLHLEVKRVERLNLYDAMAQSIHDAREGEIPVVMHRKNHCKWLITLHLDDFMEIYKEWEAGQDG